MPKPDMSVACNCGHPEPTDQIGHLLSCAVWDTQMGRVSFMDAVEIATEEEVAGPDPWEPTPAPAGPPEPIVTGNPAHDAVYAHIRSLGDHLPPSPAHRNAMIWRAVEAALRAERAAIQRRLIAAFQTDPDPGANETWTRGHSAGLMTAMDALHATTEGMGNASYPREGEK